MYLNNLYSEFSVYSLRIKIISMAKASIHSPLNLPASFSSGDHSIFTNKFGNVIVRSKGGPRPEDVRTAPQFANTRKNNIEFSGASSAAKMLGQALISVKHLNDCNIHSQFTGMIRSIFEMDPGPHGSRPVVFSRGAHLISGFQLNNKNNFDSVIRTPVTFSIDRSEHQAVLQLPPLAPGVNFKSPWPYAFFRLRINLGIVRDMHYVDGFGYKPILEDRMGYTEYLDTEWYPADTKIIGQEVGLKIKDAVFDNTCSLVLSIGIEFASMRYGEIKPIKHAGCAKILGIA